MTAPKWTLSLIAVTAVGALAPQAEGQQPKGRPAIVVQPQIVGRNGHSVIPFYPNPAVYNPYFTPLNQNPFVINSFNNPFAGPFLTNPLNQNPCNNPFAPNVFGPNVLAPNVLAPNVFVPNLNFAPNPFNNPFAPAPIIGIAPPIALQQPGFLLTRGANLQVNPWAGTVVRPISGVASTADGSVFYRVTGSSPIAPASGLYFDPQHGTYLNPSTGVITRPAAPVFVPWIP